MTDENRTASRSIRVEAEPLASGDPERLAHLQANRSLIVRRALLSTALGGVIPVPVMDDYVAGRVRAGLLVKLAEQRTVDLPLASAELMADPKEGSTVRNATFTAVTLVALKLAWKKIFALLAAGRGAEEMANTFQFATLFDHYCARLHVGGAVDRQRASELRGSIHSTVDVTEKAALVAVFRDGSRLLGRSMLEAPRWVSTRLAVLAQRWVSSRGNVSATFDPTAEVASEGDLQWLDRAARAVEERLATLGNDYLALLIDDFESRWAGRGNGGAATGDPAGPGGSGDPGR
jgi:hypothetical protein